MCSMGGESSRNYAELEVVGDGSNNCLEVAGDSWNAHLEDRRGGGRTIDAKI